MLLKRRIVIFLIALTICLSLNQILHNPWLSGLGTFIFLIIGDLVIAKYSMKKRNALLMEHCDPQAYIEQTRKQMVIMKRDRHSSALLETMLAVGYMNTGEYETARSILESVDIARLGKKDGTLLSYTIILATCLYGMGEVNEAEKIFETQLPLLAPLGERMERGVELLLVDRLFALGRYDECRMMLDAALNGTSERCTQVNLLFMKAQMDDQEGDIIAAIGGYQAVVDRGNRLYTAICAKARLELLVINGQQNERSTSDGSSASQSARDGSEALGTVPIAFVILKWYIQFIRRWRHVILHCAPIVAADLVL